MASPTSLVDIDYSTAFAYWIKKFLANFTDRDNYVDDVPAKTR